MEIYFRPIRKAGELVPLEADLESLIYNDISEGVDKNQRKLFRLKQGPLKVGIVVIVNENLTSQVKKILEKGMTL